MSDPTKRAYLGEQLTHALLQRRRDEVRGRHERAVGRVDHLLDTQRTLGDELGRGLASLSETRTELRALEQAANDTSLLASLVRPFTARRTALARRSVADGLIKQYEQVSVRLREATAFSDELHLTALELQQEVDRLHRELGEALHNQRVAAQRVLELEEALQQLEGDSSLSAEQRDRRRDRYTFDLRTESVALELFRAAAEHCRTHLPAARSLRDTVLRLHEDMAEYVLGATHTVNAAGRRIQGLGMLADAPTVVAELAASLSELDQAMRATADYVEGSQALLAEVLPELSAKVQARAESSSAVLHAELEQIDREKSRLAAERALREAAEDEIRELLGDDP
jgi:hypothetical protein